MTKNQREFQKQVARIERSMNRLLKRDNYVPVYSIPDTPKRVTRKMITRLEELSGKDFVAKVDTDTGEIIHHPAEPYVYHKHPRLINGESEHSYHHEYDPEYARRYRELHKEQIREYSRKYRERHKERIREKQRLYREKHKEQLREKQKAYREKNKERIKETQKAYRDKNKDKINARAKIRREMKKAQRQMMPNIQSYPEFDIYYKLLSIFRQALSTLTESKEIKRPDMLNNVAITYINNLISVLNDNKDKLGLDEYKQYLKANEAVIASDVNIITWDSKQERVQGAYTEVLEILNNGVVDITLDMKTNASDLEEGM